MFFSFVKFKHNLIFFAHFISYIVVFSLFLDITKKVLFKRVIEQRKTRRGRPL